MFMYAISYFFDRGKDMFYTTNNLLLTYRTSLKDIRVKQLIVLTNFRIIKKGGSHVPIKRNAI
jgi:hypothetical protein